MNHSIYHYINIIHNFTVIVKSFFIILFFFYNNAQISISLHMIEYIDRQKLERNDAYVWHCRYGFIYADTL